MDLVESELFFTAESRQQTQFGSKLVQSSIAGYADLICQGVHWRFLTSGSLLHEVHVTVPLQEFEITHPVKIILRAQFHFRVLDDLG